MHWPLVKNWIFKQKIVKKAERTIIKEVEFIPIIDYDERTHIEKWNDVGYLTQVESFASNAVFKAEVFNLIRMARQEEAKAKTQEEWKGPHAAIEYLNNVFLLPELAKQRLKTLAENKKAQKQSEKEDYGHGNSLG